VPGGDRGGIEVWLCSFFNLDARWVRLTPRPGRFNPGNETLYPLYGRVGRSRGRYTETRIISPPPGQICVLFFFQIFCISLENKHDSPIIK
jgi:hypothetical protein